MEKQEKTVDYHSKEYAESVAKRCAEEGDPLPEAFVNLLATAYCAGYSHVGCNE